MTGSLLSASRTLFTAGLALALAACAPAGYYRGGPGVPAVPQTGQLGPQVPVNPQGQVRVALLVPLSGADEGAINAGTAIANAAKMAETDIADPSLQVTVYDTTGSPAAAQAVARRAVAEGATLILGPLFASSTQGVGDVAASAGINVISFSTDSSVAGGPVFVSGFLPESEAERVISYATRQGHGRIAVFYPDTSYGNAAVRGAQQAADATRATIVTTVSYPRSFQGIQDNANAFAGAAQDAGADAILLPDSGQGLRSVGAFMDYAGLDPVNVKYLGLGQWNASATLEEPALRGGWFPAPEPSRVDYFANLYANRYGAKPPFVAVLGYDAVQVAGQALRDARRTGSRDPFGRAELTRPDGFQGVVGALRFEPDGTNRRAMAILEVGDHAFSVVDPAPARLDLGS